MNRPGLRLRDAALGYASQQIPVLPLHYPLPDRSDLQALTGDHPPPRPAVQTRCSCRDPGCGQVGKHPLGSLVPHGVKDATTNRARILAWWTRHPQANIGLATGHRFDVLDVDGPTGVHAIRALAAEHGLVSSGPLVRTGGGGWHYYLAPTGLGNIRPNDLEHVDWRGQGGYVVAPPSRHPSGHPYRWVDGRDLDDPVSYGSRPATSTTWSPPAPWTTARSTKGCSMPLSAAACSPTSRARLAAPWPQAARLAYPIPAAPPSPPAPNTPAPRRPHPYGRSASQPRSGGEGHGHRRPARRLTLFRGWARAATK
jgi:hypothetical protein